MWLVNFCLATLITPNLSGCIAALDPEDRSQDGTPTTLPQRHLLLTPRSRGLTSRFRNGPRVVKRFFLQRTAWRGAVGRGRQSAATRPACRKRVLPFTVVAGFMLPSVVGARPPHPAIQMDPERRSEKGIPDMGAYSGLAASSGSASRRRDLGEPDAFLDQGLGMDLSPPRSQHPLQGAVEAEVLPGLVQRDS